MTPSQDQAAKEAPRSLPRGVYMRRRVAVLLGAIAAIAVVVMMIAGPSTVASWFGGESDATINETSAGVETGAGEEPTQSGGAPVVETPVQSAPPGPCDTARIAVEPVTDKTSYGAGDDPELSLRVTNHSSVACDVDLGTQTMVFTVFSGDEEYWSSVHCHKDPESMIVRMDADQTLETEAIVWDRSRSNAETCGDVEPTEVPGAGASYHLKVEVAGVASETSRQFLLY